MGNRIFISYRREDSRGEAGRIYDQLVAHFGRDRIFMDVDTIQPGLDFVEAIHNAVSETDVFIAVIGPSWLESKNQLGERRLDNPEDFVRVEVASALKRNIRVIPVLLDGVVMPRSSSLPTDLKMLSRRNAIEVSHTRFHSDTQRLIGVLELALSEVEAERKVEEERAAAEKAEADRIAVEKADAERIAAEKAEAERIAAEKAEADRIAAEKAEAERIASEKAEADRKAVEKAEAGKIANEIAVQPQQDLKTELAKNKGAKSIAIGGLVVVSLLAAALIMWAFLGSRDDNHVELTKTAIAVNLTQTEVAYLALKPTSTLKPPTSPDRSSATQKVIQDRESLVLSRSKAAELNQSGVKGFYELSSELYSAEELDDMLANNNHRVYLRLTNPEPLKLGFSECSGSQKDLEDILNNTEYIFKLDGFDIDRSKIITEFYSGEDGSACSITYLIFDNWTSGLYTVYQGINIINAYVDGETEIKSGIADFIEYFVEIP